MLGQSSIEFLTTYSFLFIMLGILASLIFYFATLPPSMLPESCTAFSGPTCNAAEYYANKSAGYSFFVIALSNSGSTPISVTNITVNVRSNTFTGTCSPSLVEPGMYTLCMAGKNSIAPLGTYIQGFYTLHALACNSGIAKLGLNCNENVSYSGSFALEESQVKPQLFAVGVAAGPEGSSIPSFPNAPYIPSGWSEIENGYWATYPNGYAYTSTPQYTGSALGFKLVPFPQVTSMLNGNTLCTYPYNSALSIASTVIYVPSSRSIGVYLDTGGAAEVYYEEPGSNTWVNVFGGAAWKLQSPTVYSNTITFNNGVVKLAVVWASNCFGMQALNLTNLPQ
ncbi:MAG: hypothetical protein ACP5HW_01780 [Candidatus Micrarchaeia archaeon]|jgi:hypothetical protein